MKYHPRLSLLLALVLSAAAPAQGQGFQIESKKPPAPASLTGSEVFTSIQGRFTIALPQRISSYSPVSLDTPKGKVTAGDELTWRLDKAQFGVSYIDMPEAPPTPAATKALLDSGIDGTVDEAVKNNGKVLSRTEISLAGHQGQELRLGFPNLEIVSRFYVVGAGAYQITAAYKLEAGAKETVAKVLDSFKLLTPAEVEAAVKKKVEDAAPAPLPQAPAAKGLKSDAEGEVLKGSVKTVFTESEDLSDAWAAGKRKPRSMEFFDGRGNLTKRITYDWKGNPFDITALGYIDGERASLTKTIQYEYNPPPMMMATPPGQPKPTYDSRYSYKHKLKYDEKGRVVEKEMIGSDGKLWMRYVFNYKGNQRETLAYSADGSLNQKYVETLDARGNEVEESYYDAKTDKVRTRYSYAYDSFDPRGNWTKRTTSKWVTKDGKSYFEPSSVTHRTITYH